MSLFDFLKKNDQYKHSREFADDILSYASQVNREREKEKKNKKWAYDKIIDYAISKIDVISAYDLGAYLSAYLSGSSECPPLKMLILDEVEERIKNGKVPKNDIGLVGRKSNCEIWCFNPLLSDLDIPCEHKKEFSESKYSICKDTCKYKYSCLGGGYFHCQSLRDSQYHQENIMEIYKKFRKYLTDNQYYICSEAHLDDIGAHAFRMELEERRLNGHRILDGYVNEMRDYLTEHNSELKIGHLDYLCDVFFVKNDILKDQPYVLVPLGLKVLDYIKDRDEERYDRIYKEKFEIIRDYIFGAK